MTRDLVTDMKQMEKVVRGFEREPGSLLDYEGAGGKGKRPVGRDRNLGGYVFSCPKCGLAYFPDKKKDAECPFCE